MDYAAGGVREPSLDICTEFPTVKTSHNLNSFYLTLIQADHGHWLREGRNSKLLTATFQADRGNFLVLKRPSQQKQNHLFNHSPSEIVFILV